MQKSGSPVEEFFQANRPWSPELRLLRSIVQKTDLAEEWKWRAPCYTLNGKNVVLIQRFKNYCGLLFFKGAMVKDPHQLLVKPGEHTQAGRLIKFTTPEEIKKLQKELLGYIRDAMEVEQSGEKIAISKPSTQSIPEELKEQFIKDASLKIAFHALTPGRQRAYLLFFEAPKQSQTRTARIAKMRQRILSGKGLTDCICGLTRKPPYCDGSHRQLTTSSPKYN